MCRSMLQNRVVWLGAGLLTGLLAGALWPDAPIRAVATSHQDNLVMCTGSVDGKGEAVYILDSITGTLRAYVLSPVGKFTVRYQNNVIKDMELDVQKNPRYTMVTGNHRFSRAGAGTGNWGNSVLYVAEVTSGKMIAYAMPWNTAVRNTGRGGSTTLIPVDSMQFREPVVRSINARTDPPRVGLEFDAGTASRYLEAVAVLDRWMDLRRAETLARIA